MKCLALLICLLLTSCTRPSASGQPKASEKESDGRAHDITTRELFELKLRCAELGQRYHERIARSTDNPMMAEQFHYNAKLNTCLYKGGMVLKAGNKVNGASEFIVDLATNRELAFYTTFGKTKEEMADEQLRFSRSAQALMGH